MGLLFGTAGIPHSAKGFGIINGISEVRRLGLNALELEFVHSVNVSEELSPKIKAAAEENKLALTCHGQYYINLNAADKKKLEASKQRLLRAAHIANLCGATSVAFHPGFYLKSGKEEAYMNVKAALKDVVDTLKQANNKIWIRPETTGKHSQFGNLRELLKLAKELEQVQPCIDYAHIRARDGKNDKQGFAGILIAIEKELGREALDNMHIQASGVNFSEKGELNHLALKDSDLRYEEMVETWKDFGVKGVVISESPNIEDDALLLKKTYSK